MIVTGPGGQRDLHAARLRDRCREVARSVGKRREVFDTRTAKTSVTVVEPYLEPSMRKDLFDDQVRRPVPVQVGCRNRQGCFIGLKR